jgi:maltooligosyltrehalose trehalohydrolase
VNFVQNHDQIGNRPHGDRLAATVAAEPLAAAAAVTLLAPMPVLMFMGEEWASRRPFPFFCDFHGELSEAVRAGRRREFAEAYQDLAHPVPDPLAAATFQSAKIDWDALVEPRHAAWLSLVRELLAIRRREIVPFFGGSATRTASANGVLIAARWTGAEGKTLHLLANAGTHPVCPGPDMRPRGRAIFGGAPAVTIPAWSVHWSVEER